MTNLGTTVLTKEDFAAQIAALTEKDNKFNVESLDSGSVFLSLFGCKVEVDLNWGDGEIVLHKPYTNMEVRLDFGIIDEIVKDEDGSYCISFDNGMSDITFEQV